MQLKDEDIIAAYRLGEAAGQRFPSHPKPQWILPGTITHPCLRHLWLCGYEEGKRMHDMLKGGKP